MVSPSGNASELFGHVGVLREELFDAPGARHGDFIFFGEFVHTQDGDDVLEFLVLLEDHLYPGRSFVVVLAHVARVEDT